METLLKVDNHFGRCIELLVGMYVRNPHSYPPTPSPDVCEGSQGLAFAVLPKMTFLLGFIAWDGTKISTGLAPTVLGWNQKCLMFRVFLK